MVVTPFFGSYVYAGGSFSTIGGQARSRLAELDLQTGAATDWDPQPNDEVDAAFASPDWTVYAGGRFNTMELAPQSGFASFSVPPQSAEPPEIFGTPMPGETLGVSNGLWWGSVPMTFTYQWLRDGDPISGETNQSYTVRDEDVGHAIACRVTATNLGGSDSANSRPVMVIGPPPPPPPPPRPPPAAAATTASTTSASPTASSARLPLRRRRHRRHHHLHLSARASCHGSSG